MTFNDRTAVITGAAGKIGRKTALEFSRYGVKLYLTDIDMERLNALVEELRKVNPEVYAVEMDVSSLESIEKASQTIFQQAGKVDILINNAGAWPRGTALESSDEPISGSVNRMKFL